MPADITFDFKDFEKGLTIALAKEFDKRISRRLKGLKTRTGQILSKYLRKSTTYSSLLGGKLQGELGVEEPEPALEAILEYIQDSIDIQYDPVIKKTLILRRSRVVNGIIKINMVPSDLAGLIDLEAGKFETEKGDVIEWLNWLLLEGNSPIIYDYKFTANFLEYSRTGKGIMIKANNKIWKVPDQHSGTIGDNWITRTLDFYGEQIAQEIGEEIRRRLEA